MHRIVLALVVLSASVARAEEDPALELLPAPAPAHHRAWAALSIGALVPQAFNRLGLAAAPELSGGAFLLDGRLGLAGSVSFAESPHTRTFGDPRVPGGGATLALAVQDLRIGAGAQWHFDTTASALSPYAGARVKLHLVGARSEGSAGSSMGQYDEQWTGFGGAAYGGAMYRLGPGALVGELELDVAPVSQRLTGSSNLSAFALKLGYGLLF